MKFTVVPYMKGTSNRGFILGAIDEILQCLDDSSMNLQSMSASRFIGPFMNSVQNWEKSLSHISEVLDVSLHGPPPLEAWCFTEKIHQFSAKCERGLTP